MYIAKRALPDWMVFRIYDGPAPDDYLAQFRQSIRESIIAMGIWLPKSSEK